MNEWLLLPLVLALAAVGVPTPAFAGVVAAFALGTLALRARRRRPAQMPAALPATGGDEERFDAVLDEVLAECPQIPNHVRAEIRGRVFRRLAGARR